jgi:hypothetical protein
MGQEHLGCFYVVVGQATSVAVASSLAGIGLGRPGQSFLSLSQP